MSSAHDSTPPEELARQRVPLERKVSLKFKEFRGFITEYSANISLGGMFIRSDAPQPMGTRFDFELGLEDDFTLLQGIGEVVWVRERGEGPSRPAGMGVRFLDLEPESEELILKMVEQHVQSGGTPFDLEAAGGQSAPGQAPPQDPQAADPMSRTVSLGWGQLGPSRVTYAQGTGGSDAGSVPPATGLEQEPEPVPATRGKSGSEEPPFGGRVEDLLGGPQGPETVREAVLPGEPPRDDQARASAPTREERLPAGVEEVARVFGSSGPPSQPSARDSAETTSPSSAPARSGGSEPHQLELPSPAPLEIAEPAAPSREGASQEPPGPTGKPYPWQISEHEPNEPKPYELEPIDQDTFPTDPYHDEGEGPFPSDLGYGSPMKRRSKARPVLMALGLLVLLGAAATFLVLDHRVPLPEPLASWFAEPDTPPPAPDLGAPLPLSKARPGAGTIFERRSTEAESDTGVRDLAPGPEPEESPGVAPTDNDVPPLLPEPEPEPAAPPQPVVAEVPEAVSSSRLTRLEDVRWERTEDGTVVVLIADGGFREGAIRQFRLGGESTREVVRILGVQQPYGRATTRVGTGQVAQVRIGHHAGNELHVVLDLTGPGVSLERTEARGTRLLLYLVGG